MCLFAGVLIWPKVAGSRARRTRGRSAGPSRIRPLSPSQRSDRQPGSLTEVRDSSPVGCKPLRLRLAERGKPGFPRWPPRWDRRASRGLRFAVTRTRWGRARHVGRGGECLNPCG
jgi:hypothetical protein